MRKLPAVLLVMTLMASGAYIAIYLNRWEWNRALFVTMVFIAAEIALVGWLVVNRLRALEDQVQQSSEGESGYSEKVLLQLREARPEHDRFEWLRESATRHNVFITMVVGAGVAVSALAWILDKIAETTVTPARERRLARELNNISFQPGQLVASEASLIAEDRASFEDPELRLLVGDTSRPTR